MNDWTIGPLVAVSADASYEISGVSSGRVSCLLEGAGRFCHWDGVDWYIPTLQGELKPVSDTSLVKECMLPRFPLRRVSNNVQGLQ